MICLRCGADTFTGTEWCRSCMNVNVGAFSVYQPFTCYNCGTITQAGVVPQDSRENLRTMFCDEDCRKAYQVREHVKYKIRSKR